MDHDLITGLDTPDQEPGGFTLWFRSDSRHKWKQIGSAPTHYGALTHMNHVGSGDFLIMPAGENPEASKNGKA